MSLPRLLNSYRNGVLLTTGELVDALAEQQLQPQADDRAAFADCVLADWSTDPDVLAALSLDAWAGHPPAEPLADNRVALLAAALDRCLRAADGADVPERFARVAGDVPRDRRPCRRTGRWPKSAPCCRRSG